MDRVLTVIGAATPETRAAVDERWRSDSAATSGVRVFGASLEDSDVTLRLSGDATPDAVWGATLEHLAAQSG
jgi:hypothetical protein